MPGLVIVGAQWGDEGKGKLVDYLTARADWVVRFHGGSNAGHTLVVNGVKHKLNLVPSGILRSNVRCLVAAGVVLHPKVFWEEVQNLRRAGVAVTSDNLLIDRDVHLVMPYHIAIDQAREEAKGKNKIGTTGRGIGPAYEHRAARCGIRLADLADFPAARRLLEENVENSNRYLRHVLGAQVQVELSECLEWLGLAARELLPCMANGGLLLDGSLRKGERVVFEGAQGTMLDPTFGALPFVTSSHTLAGAVTTGCGLGARAVSYVLGVVKAYSTRVGGGPFPTELTDSVGDGIRERGAEFGTNTGRPRRCGWLDAVALRRAVRLNGIDSIALTKLDVLTGIDTLRIGNKYRDRATVLEDVPALCSEQERVEVEYVELEGWKEDLSGCRQLSDLPRQARRYLDVLMELVGCPITIVSVSPERHSTFFLSRDPLVAGFME